MQVDGSSLDPDLHSWGPDGMDHYNFSSRHIPPFRYATAKHPFWAFNNHALKSQARPAPPARPPAPHRNAPPAAETWRRGAARPALVGGPIVRAGLRARAVRARRAGLACRRAMRGRRPRLSLVGDVCVGGGCARGRSRRSRTRRGRPPCG